MPAHVSALDALIDQYIDARTAEEPLWQAVEAARQNAEAAFNPSLLSAWFAKNELSEKLYRVLEAMQLDGKGWTPELLEADYQ